LFSFFPLLITYAAGKGEEYDGNVTIEGRIRELRIWKG
jgi:hypothetical protein